MVDSAGRVVTVATGRCRFISDAGISPVHERPVAPPPDPQPSSIVSAIGLAAADDEGGAWPAGLSRRVENGTQLVVPAGPMLANAGKTVHGGMHLCLSDLATTAAEREHTISIRISYLRPADPAQPVTYTVLPVHQGRLLAVYQVVSSGPLRQAVHRRHGHAPPPARVSRLLNQSPRTTASRGRASRPEDAG